MHTVRPIDRSVLLSQERFSELVSVGSNLTSSRRAADARPNGTGASARRRPPLIPTAKGLQTWSRCRWGAARVNLAKLQFVVGIISIENLERPVRNQEARHKTTREGAARPLLEMIGFIPSDAISAWSFSLSHLPARFLLLQQPLAFDLIAVREGTADHPRLDANCFLSSVQRLGCRAWRRAGDNQFVQER
jgi:hypothetical protein